MPSKPIYAPFIENNIVLCSRCFSVPGDVKKYGVDERGYWFIAPCSKCGAKMKWYLDNDGVFSGCGKEDEPAESSFAFHMENGEIVMKYE